MNAVTRLICAAALLVASSALSATVDNVELSYEQGYTVAKIYVTGDIRFSHQSEVAKDGRPYRVIVDILTAAHNLGAKEYLEVPACAVKGIRSSQYAVKPEKVCRIVFDMVGETIYKAEQQPDAVVIYFSDGFSSPFANWSSKSWVAGSKSELPASASQPTAEVSPATETQQEQAEVADINDTIAQDKLASLQPSPTAPTQSDASSVHAVTEADKNVDSSAAPKPLSRSFTMHATMKDAESATVDKATPVQAENPKNEFEPFVVEQLMPETTAILQPETMTDTTIAAVSEHVVGLTASVIDSSTDATIDSVVHKSDSLQPTVSVAETTAVQDPTLTSFDSSQLNLGNGKARERSSVKSSRALSSLGSDFDLSIVDTPSGSTQAESTSAFHDASVSENTGSQTEPAMLADADAATYVESPKAKTDAPHSDKNEPVKSEGPAKETEAPSTANVVKALKTPSTSESTPSASSRTEPIVQNPTLADIAPAVDTTSQSISDDAKAKGTARFRRDPITSKKMRGTLVAEFPQRLVIQYKGSSGRDPFETLIDEEKQYNVPIEKRVPNVEGLSLVGVIESGWGDNRALFEDRSGHGYIMQSGDKVQKGYVLRVEKDRVYFQLFEYGWSRTVSITLDEE